MLQITAFVVPGLAFDREGGRSGGAAATTTRPSLRRPMRLRIGLAFECQLLDHVPARSARYEAPPRRHRARELPVMDPIYLLAAVALGLVGRSVRRDPTRSREGRWQRRADVPPKKKRRRSAPPPRARSTRSRRRPSVEGKEAARKHKAELDEELRGRRTELAEARGGARREGARGREGTPRRRAPRRRAREEGEERRRQDQAGRRRRREGRGRAGRGAQEARADRRALRGAGAQEARGRGASRRRYAQAAVEIKRIEDDAAQGGDRAREDDRRHRDPALRVASSCTSARSRWCRCRPTTSRAA